jgi:hypothetical protein
MDKNKRNPERTHKWNSSRSLLGICLEDKDERIGELTSRSTTGTSIHFSRKVE